MKPIARLRRSLSPIGAAVIALALFAPGAHASLLASAPTCPDQTLETPFLPWLDPAAYTLAPEGTVESTTNWRLRGATRVLGNEPYLVHAPDDKYSLSLPSGSSATTPPMCIGLEHPTLRLFVRNTGSPLSLLNVEVLVRDDLGLPREIPIGALAATSTWQPTVPMPVVANLLALLPGDRATVQFRFTPQDSGGAWRIDDVYVDPYRK